MSLNKINKEFKKLYRLYKNTDISRETIIFSDSKGFSLRDVLNDRLKQKITVIAKSGANIYNNTHYYKVKKAVKKAKNPVVIVWLATCDVTKKKGKYISAKSYPYQKIEFALNKYRTLKSRLLQANPEATVVFLECPYYSITRFNKFKITNSNSKTGTNKYYQRNSIAAAIADKQVCCMVDYFNDHLRLINRNCGTPRISQDIIASSKGARPERTSYRKNWNVYSDGMHPVRALARLWLYRVIELATEIAAKTESCG